MYIQVDIIFNYMFHPGLPGTCLYRSPGNTLFCPGSASTRNVCLNYFYKDMFLEVQMKHEVKYDVYLDVLLVVSIYVMKSEWGGMPWARYLVPVRVCLLVAVGCGGRWLIVVAVVAVVIGVTPRMFQVDILAKVLSSQELHKKSSLDKRCGAMQHVFLHRILMRILLAQSFEQIDHISMFAARGP